MDHRQPQGGRWIETPVPVVDRPPVTRALIEKLLAFSISIVVAGLSLTPLFCARGLLQALVCSLLFDTGGVLAARPASAFCVAPVLLAAASHHQWHRAHRNKGTGTDGRGKSTCKSPPARASNMICHAYASIHPSSGHTHSHCHTHTSSPGLGRCILMTHTYMHNQCIAAASLNSRRLSACDAACMLMGNRSMCLRVVLMHIISRFVLLRFGL
jgi:hypothetical protein